MSATAQRQVLLPLVPDYRTRVWGGQRLQAASPPIGEAWIAFEESAVASGPCAGNTVADLVRADAAGLLGTAAADRFDRFPLLVKLLDTADWLSVQVHPTDEQARRMVGPTAFGKTEAWYFLDVEPGASILAGVTDGVTREQVAAAIRGNSLLDIAARVEVRAGEAMLVPAGMLHALGPGLLLYEVQEASDTTYRAYDWDRPASPERRLHIDECLEVMAPIVAQPGVSGVARDDACTSDVLACPYFDLDTIHLTGDGAARADTEGLSFHVLTVTEGSVEVACGGERVRVGRFETVLVAGSGGPYVMTCQGGAATVIRSSVPPR